MTPTPPPVELDLLRGVSRSFYLSIRLLPAALRAPVAVGYLLARATDTIADTAELPAARRREQLGVLAAAIEGDAAARAGIGALARDFSALQHDDDERRLVRALPMCLAWLDALGGADGADVREVLRQITRGQLLDVERFGAGSGARALASAAELDEYTYLVAGCVGEFWTALCFRHLPGFARLPREEMLSLARDYGMGLQLVNILRDMRADLEGGRCYLPGGAPAGAGLAPQDAPSETARLAGIRKPWLALASQRLEAGMRYALAVESRRVRAASALPALIGARTLALMRDQDAAGRPLDKAKVPRAQVRGIAARLLLTLAARGNLRAQYQRLRR